MASNNNYLVYVLELLREVDGISYKKMMGEYILYKDGVIFGGIYDNLFLVKNSKSIDEDEFKKIVPYPNAKPMLLIDSEDPDEIRDIVYTIVNDLK